LTRREGFDPEELARLADSILKAKSAINLYLISVLGAVEGGELDYRMKSRAHVI
jgi:hypothetical protein